MEERDHQRHLSGIVSNSASIILPNCSSTMQTSNGLDSGAAAVPVLTIKGGNAATQYPDGCCSSRSGVRGEGGAAIAGGVPATNLSQQRHTGVDENLLVASNVSCGGDSGRVRIIPSGGGRAIASTSGCTGGNAGPAVLSSSSFGRGTDRNGTGDDNNGYVDNYGALKYDAVHLIRMFVPVSICMAVVVLTTATVGYYTQRSDGVVLFYAPIQTPPDDEYTTKNLLLSLANALIMLVFVALATVLLVFLYKRRYYKVISAWLMTGSFMLLSTFTAIYIEELFRNYNIALDYITLTFFIWNWALFGMMCIHWKGPLILQQMYLIAQSALMALVFIKYLPGWTVWTVLGVLSIWDLVAVLSPIGPLRILVETAQSRGEPLFPSMVYHSGMLYPYHILTTAAATVLTSGASEGTTIADESARGDDNEMDGLVVNDGEDEIEQEASSSKVNTANASGRVTSEAVASVAAPSGSTTKSAGNNYGCPKIAAISPSSTGHIQRAAVSTPQNTTISVIGGTTSGRDSNARNGYDGGNDEEQCIDDEDDRGVKLGLGDFIFYSVLVGKASSFGDWNTTIACYTAILVGLASTLMLLALFRKALPALPISVFGGILFFIATRAFITPFTTELAFHQYLI